MDYGYGFSQWYTIIIEYPCTGLSHVYFISRQPLPPSSKDPKSTRDADSMNSRKVMEPSPRCGLRISWGWRVPCTVKYDRFVNDVYNVYGCHWGLSWLFLLNVHIAQYDRFCWLTVLFSVHDCTEFLTHRTNTCSLSILLDIIGIVTNWTKKSMFDYETTKEFMGFNQVKVGHWMGQVVESILPRSTVKFTLMVNHNGW